jgi:predicted nucleic acid-binding protein
MAATDPAAVTVVSDAGPLIHLDELDCIDLLADFAPVLVPEAVWREVHLHRPSALAHSEVDFVRVSPPSSPKAAALEALARLLVLHTGELEALQVALEHERSLLLTDDTAARLAAGNLSIPVHGTIGVVVRSIRCHQRTAEQVLAVLRSLPQQSTLHLKRSLLDAVIQEVESSI